MASISQTRIRLARFNLTRKSECRGRANETMAMDRRAKVSYAAFTSSPRNRDARNGGMPVV